MNSSPQNSSTVKWSVERLWVTVAFCLALLLMGAVNFISYQNATQLIDRTVQLKQTTELLATLTHVSATLTDAESRRWRYILFDDRQELEAYDQAIESLDLKLEQLRQPLTDKPGQEQRLDQLEALIHQRRQLLAQSTELYRQMRSQLTAEHPLLVQANQNQTQIYQVIAELEITEEERLEVQVKQSQASSQARMIIEICGTALTFAVLLGVYALLYRQMFKRQELEQMQQKLAQEKELGELKLQFFSMVSHEFRTPLSSILGSAQLLRETLYSTIDAAKLKGLLRIQASARLMTQLLNDILTLARADAGKLECRPELLEIQSFCLNLIEDLQLLNEPPRAIQFSQQGNCTHAYLDEKLLYSILSNLLSNAIKYSPADSPIYFTLYCEPGSIAFQVRDEGMGIAPEDQAQLYEPFIRGKNIGNTTGSGLGMAVVKKCLDLHQGEIELESEVGLGTTFTLKIAQPPASQAGSGELSLPAQAR
ncbi:ATP-binding protein [Pseudanabaena sp. FACHB-2040]|uniref:sensor histidine kinase n=1 Tax=Pseudanabaena sp. FACHB-2040 TaxID=2692859 RepID=UPI001689EA69|nr:ATP-binding protein [Pseudanabaena sp. FACHB-2040]MBD2258777.1 CHASE3 domain-containing protein [Pseudanabaena sp. FACHB-2040]